MGPAERVAQLSPDPLAVRFVSLRFLSSSGSSVAPYPPPDEGGRSSRVSEASSGAILSAHVSYARNIRHRVRGDDPERAMEYSEEEAEADKAYCQRIRRQLRYTFGGP